MKVIRKEKIEKSYYNVYVADDGTEFRDEDQCKKYNESAKGVLMAKIRPLVTKEICEEDIFGFGSCDSTIWVMKPNSQEDADAILQMYIMYHSYMTDDDHKHYIERARSNVQRALNENDAIMVGRGFEMDDFWLIGTINSMKKELDKYLNVEEKKENA